MLVTRKSDYAIRSLVFLAKAPDHHASASQIGASMMIPEVFVAKILQDLGRAGLIESVRGAKGGYRLARPPEAINLLEILEAIQGPTAINTCAVEEGQCALSGGCPVHPIWIDVRKMVEDRLRAADLATLAATDRPISPPLP